MQVAFLWFSESPATLCFMLTAAGSLLVFVAWRAAGVGLPIIPLFAFQNLLSFGLPIVVNNPTVLQYGEADFTRAGVELLIFSAALAASWRFGMQVLPAPKAVCYALIGFAHRKQARVVSIAFSLCAAATGYSLLFSAGMFEPVFALLPRGAASVATALATATSICGFFLGAMVLGATTTSVVHRVAFWIMLTLNCLVTASSLQLFATSTYLSAVIVGLFWRTGRLPMAFLLVAISALSLLNLGKMEMRQRYWPADEDEARIVIRLQDFPSFFQEWLGTSFDVLTGKSASDTPTPDVPFAVSEPEGTDGQSLFDRINNLQNLLFVIDAMRTDHTPPVYGATYALIPPLLMPRVFWPDKPRAHAGQILLNVHFGRQDLHATFRTYIAWGIIAEAYGNFGPIAGTAVLGLVLGLLCAWFELFMARKLLLSMEGLLSLALFVGLANSMEMVASVLVTTLFQSFVLIVVVCLPFVQRIDPDRRAVETQ